MESWLLRHEACPECRKNGKDKAGNNLGVYSDGHTYCFSCGVSNASFSSRIANFDKTSTAEKVEQIVTLPEDCSFTYPKRAFKWIEQYELSNNDLLTNGVLWSDKHQRLIFPVYGDYKLLAYQGRYFGADLNEQKWFGRGNLKNVFHFLGKNETKLVLVEDIVSAIKVGHIMQTMPLFGSAISIERFKRIKFLVKPQTEVMIWLDKDKAKEALRFQRRGSLCGLNTRVIITEKDPKENSYGTIRQLVLGE